MLLLRWRKWHKWHLASICIWSSVTGEDGGGFIFTFLGEGRGSKVFRSLNHMHAVLSIFPTLLMAETLQETPTSLKETDFPQEPRLFSSAFFNPEQTLRAPSYTPAPPHSQIQMRFA